MPNNDYANEPNQSRSEDIIQSILDNTEYDEPAGSRIEYLLVELKSAIEGGGGGGGVTSYSPLTEKPKIDNHTLQAGNNTSSDLGLQTKLTFDSAPTEKSTNPVTSGGIYTSLGTKANSSDVYNKSAVDTALSAKADKSTTYTKTEVDTALSSKQNTISDLSTIRSGAALGATALQPVSGKGLSTNDYTDAEKSKLAGIEAQANKTTVDSALSGTSINPVQNKVVKSALDSKQASLTTAQLAAVNSGIDSDDVEQITTNKNNISYNTNNGVKNIINVQVPSSVVRTSYTPLSNGGVELSCTNASWTSYNLENIGVTAGVQYTIKTLLDESTATDFHVFVRETNSSGTNLASHYYGNGTGERNTDFTSSSGTIWIGLYLNNSATARTATAKIRVMICPKTIYDSDNSYQPYALSNAELTAKEQVNENNILYNTNTGVKNLFNNTATSGSQKGITYTVNSDGTVTTSDSTTSGAFILKLGEFTFEQGKTYYFTGCPSGGTQNGYRLCTLGDTYADDFGNGDEVVGDGSTRNIAIYARNSGTNMDGLTFKPMIREIGDDTYQPYALSNVELTAKEQVNENNILSLTPTTTTTDYTATAAETWEKTSLSIPVAGKKAVFFSGNIMYNNAEPLGVGIGIGNTFSSTAIVAMEESTTGTLRGALSCTGIYYNNSSSPQTLDLWVKYKTAQRNMITLMYRQL